MQTEVFKFENHPITSVIRDDGSIWFVASDVCKVLGLTNPTEALKRLYKNEKLPSEILRAGQKRKVNIISESGLYKLIMRSTKPEAIRFQDWVCQEVLPTIRQEGGYINVHDIRDPYEIIDNMYIQASKMQEIITKQKQEISELSPKAQMFEDFFAPINEAISFNTMAKLSKFVDIKDGKPIGGILLKNKCIEEGFIGSRDRQANQFYVNKGYFTVIYKKCYDRDEGSITVPVTLITPKGQKWLYNRMLKHFNRAA